GARPREDRALLVGDRDDGVVEGGLDMDHPVQHVPLLARLPAARRALLLRHGLLPFLPADTYRPLRPLARARVRARALPTDGQTAPVPQTAIGTDLLQAPDIQRDLAPEVALHAIFALQHLAKARHLGLRQFPDARVGVHLRLGQNPSARGLPDPEN